MENPDSITACAARTWWLNADPFLQRRAICGPWAPTPPTVGRPA